MDGLQMPSSYSADPNRPHYNENLPSLLPQSTPLSRIVVYASDLFRNDGSHVSLLPLVTKPTGATHIVIGAIVIAERRGEITLNGDAVDNDRLRKIWSEIPWLRGAKAKVMLSLGGGKEGKGSFARLGGDEDDFDTRIAPLIDLIREHSIDGVDLDINEDISVEIPTRVIWRLRHEFGRAFTISMSPHYNAFLPSTISNPSIAVRPFKFPNISVQTSSSIDPSSVSTLTHPAGFSYPFLFSKNSDLIDFFAIKMPCSGLQSFVMEPEYYRALLECGWPQDRIVLSIYSSPSVAAAAGEIAGYTGIRLLWRSLFTYATTFLPQGRGTVLPGCGEGFGGVAIRDYASAGEVETVFLDGCPTTEREAATAQRGETRRMEPWEYVRTFGESLRHPSLAPVYTPEAGYRKEYERHLMQPVCRERRNYVIKENDGDPNRSVRIETMGTAVRHNTARNPRLQAATPDIRTRAHAEFGRRNNEQPMTLRGRQDDTQTTQSGGSSNIDPEATDIVRSAREAGVIGANERVIAVTPEQSRNLMSLLDRVLGDGSQFPRPPAYAQSREDSSSSQTPQQTELEEDFSLYADHEPCRDEDVELLLLLGFQRDTAKAALLRARGDVDEALRILLRRRNN